MYHSTSLKNNLNAWVKLLVTVPDHVDGQDILSEGLNMGLKKWWI